MASMQNLMEIEKMFNGYRPNSKACWHKELGRGIDYNNGLALVDGRPMRMLL